MKKKTDKPAPDATIYLTKTGERVRVTRAKQFPIRADYRDWEKEMHKEANERKVVVRVSDGHELWGCKVEDLVPEKSK